MSRELGSLLKRPALRHHVRSALESGTGVHRHDWKVDSHDVNQLVADILTWCRRTAGRTRRPYGIDSLTLAMAALDAGGVTTAFERFDEVAPADLYDEEKSACTIRAALDKWIADELLRTDGRLAVTLFSWGDLADDLLAPPSSRLQE